MSITWYEVMLNDMYYMCLTGSGYEALDVDMSKIQAGARQQKALIKYYEKTHK